MRAFINTEYYVACKTSKEVNDFLQMCEEKGLLARGGERPTKSGVQRLRQGTFAHNWRGPKDGLSHWSGFFTDGKKPIITFQEFVDRQQEPVDFEDFDSLL